VWNGFVPLAETLGTTVVNNGSRDLLLTPEVNGVNGGTVNTTATIGGISGGASVGSSETFRVDFVVDLRGDPSDVGGGDYDTLSKRDHEFDEHYLVNGASALFKSTTGSTINLAAFDDPDGNNVVGDGALVAINGVVITWRGGAPSAKITANGTYTVNGPGLTTHAFTVTFNANGTVDVAGVEGDSGASLAGTVIAVFSANGFDSVEYSYVSGDTFQIGDFGATVQTTNPVTLTVPVTIQDGDGDQLASGSLNVTLNPVTPPIVLDLDGDGVEFVPVAAGVAFDYGNDGTAEATAWAGRDDGILAIDLDGDGKITSAEEFVFGSGDLTDLEGLAAKYDSNKDGVLDANDAAFAKFGIWQDADSDGVADGGEFKTLAEVGIVSINLKSDGVVDTAANGDVTVHGTGTYTRADGTTGKLADASFAVKNERAAVRPSELAVATAVAGVLAGAAVATAAAATPTEVANGNAPGASDPASTALLDSGQTTEPPAAANYLKEGASTDTAKTGNDNNMSDLGDGDTSTFASVVDAGTSKASTTADVAGDEAHQDTSAADSQLMHALLGMGAANDGGGEQASTDLLAVQEALAQGEQTEFVDQLVESNSDSTGPTATGSADGASGLLTVTVSRDTSAHFTSFDANQVVDDAHAMAAAA
jgi:hypothetical protein